MDNAVTWAAIAGIIGVMGTVFGVFWKVSVRLDQRHNQLHERVNEVKRELANYKVHVAETYSYSTNEAMTRALDKVNEAIDRLADRLDRFIEKTGGG